MYILYIIDSETSSEEYETMAKLWHLQSSYFDASRKYNQGPSSRKTTKIHKVFRPKNNGFKAILFAAFMAIVGLTLNEDDGLTIVGLTINEGDGRGSAQHPFALGIRQLMRKEHDGKHVAAELVKESEMSFQQKNVTTKNVTAPLKLWSYTSENVKITMSAFTRELFLLYYCPKDDTFKIYIDEKKDKWVLPNKNRLNVIVPTLTFALRNHFRTRFQGAKHNLNELILLFSSGDEPKLNCKCVPAESRAENAEFCKNEIFAPILQFGSVYRDPNIVPNLIT